MGFQDVHVRDGTAEDLPTIVELIRLGALGHSVEELEDLSPYKAALAEIDSSLSSLLVALVDDQVVGTLQLVVFRHLQHNGGLCAELESVHVRPEFRSQGVGGALVEAAVERAREQGCYRVQLTSNVQRDEAHRFYENHGFEQSHLGFKRFLA